MRTLPQLWPGPAGKGSSIEGSSPTERVAAGYF